MNLTESELKIAKLAVLNSRIDTETKNTAKSLRIKILEVALGYERRIQESGVMACFSDFVEFVNQEGCEICRISNKQAFEIVNDVFDCLYSNTNSLANNIVRAEYIKTIKKLS